MPTGNKSIKMREALPEDGAHKLVYILTSKLLLSHTLPMQGELHLATALQLNIGWFWFWAIHLTDMVCPCSSLEKRKKDLLGRQHVLF